MTLNMIVAFEENRTLNTKIKFPQLLHLFNKDGLGVPFRQLLETLVVD